MTSRGAEAFPPLSSTARVEIAANTSRGAGRRHNEDHFLVLRLARSQDTLATSLQASDVPSPFEEHAYAMFVADGLGEGGAGSLASRVALSTIANLALHHGRWPMRVDPPTAEQIIERAQEYYDRADFEVSLRGLGDSPFTNLATALTAAYSAGNSLFITHVGHSRAYLARNGTVTQLTRDHTLEQHLARSTGPIGVESRVQDVGHLLTDVVGSGSRPPADVEQFRLEDGDSVLLCTNGLTDVVDDHRIAETLALPRRPAEQCTLLLDLVKERGGEDNVTVVLAQYRFPADARAAG